MKREEGNLLHLDELPPRRTAGGALGTAEFEDILLDSSEEVNRTAEPEEVNDTPSPSDSFCFYAGENVLHDFLDVDMVEAWLNLKTDIDDYDDGDDVYIS